MLIRGGRIVTDQGTLDADVLIEGGLISSLGTRLAGNGEVIDASGCWVLPGCFDPHVHTSLEGHSVNEPMLDDLEEASRVALLGGVTTIGAYAQRTPTHAVLEMLERQIDFGRKASYVDFVMNALCFPGDDVPHVVETGVRKLGVCAFKAFLSYHNRGLMTEDDDLLDMMRAAAAEDALVLVHAENGRVISRLERHEREQRPITNDALVRTAPGEIEADGIFKSAMLSRLTRCRVLFVHVTSRMGVETLGWLKSRPGGDLLAAETQPHYLFLTNDAVLERGGLAKVGPPLKGEEDRQAVRHAVGTGLVSHLSSDHSPRSRDVKMAAAHILDAPYGGISGAEVLLALTYRLFEEGLVDIEQVARLTSSNAARVHGLYPRKGSIRPGADADIVVVPIDGEDRPIMPATLHGRSDYSLYEGLSSRGFPRYVVRAGHLVVEDAEILERVPGRYLGSE